MPVRYYSAGMMVRLAFSIATAIEPEILLVDEVLSVGDMAFQEKARERMREMIAKAKLIVLVSHDLINLGSSATGPCGWTTAGSAGRTNAGDHPRLYRLRPRRSKSRPPDRILIDSGPRERIA